jgi:putative phosphoribosyl transferase
MSSYWSSPGVPFAAVAARALDAPLDVIVVQKLGDPSQPELALGAIGEDAVRVQNEQIIGTTHLGAADMELVLQGERAELGRRAERHRGAHGRVDLRGRRALIVADGIATGATARAACLVARAQRTSRVVLAVPVAPARVVSALREVCDDVLCVALPDSIFAVGAFCDDFLPRTDDEVVRVLRRRT